MSENNIKKGEVVIYKSPDGQEIQVKLKQETIWLDAHLIAKIFGVQRPAVVKHILNIYKTGELKEKSTCSILEQVAGDGKIRKMKAYSLDVIISVGYRVNSLKATQFRIWANKVLKQYLINGYAINQKKLLEAKSKFYELQQAVLFFQKQSQKKVLKGQETEIINLLTDYSKTLSILQQYDEGNLKTKKGQKNAFILKYERCAGIIYQIRKNLIAKKQAGELFARETKGYFRGIIGSLYQTFDKRELYPTIEDKAAHLLYLTIKNHPFFDGNKRVASFLFVYFLDKSNYLFKKSGERKINDNALTALALFIAESNPKDKVVMVKIIKNLLAE